MKNPDSTDELPLSPLVKCYFSNQRKTKLDPKHLWKDPIQIITLFFNINLLHPWNDFLAPVTRSSIVKFFSIKYSLLDFHSLFFK